MRVDELAGAEHAVVAATPSNREALEAYIQLPLSKSRGNRYWPIDLDSEIGVVLQPDMQDANASNASSSSQASGL